MRWFITAAMAAVMALAGPQAVATAEARATVTLDKAVAVTPDFTGLCRDGDTRVWAIISYTHDGGPGLFSIKVERPGEDDRQWSLPTGAAGTFHDRQYLGEQYITSTIEYTVSLLYTDEATGATEQIGAAHRFTVKRTCTEVVVTQLDAPEPFTGECGKDFTLHVRAVVYSPIAQTAKFSFMTMDWNRWSFTSTQTVVFDQPGSKVVYGHIARVPASIVRLSFSEPTDYWDLTTKPLSITCTGAPRAEGIASLSTIHWSGTCVPGASTPLKARLQVPYGSWSYDWVDENGAPLPGNEEQWISATTPKTVEVTGPALSRERAGGGKVGIRFSSSDTIHDLTAWSTTCNAVTPRIDGYEWINEETSCTRSKPGNYRVLGTLRAQPGAVTARYRLVRKTDGQTYSGAWNETAIPAGGTATVSATWSGPLGTRGTWALEVDAPFAGASAAVPYFFSC
ncbi:hypothetical protein ABZ897_09450 [Nonomuraea sp. NPDC046802]|uniref:hypothetical protein n=1 Tax=Nonomuraea sp. NPDC046802 TaxID=3154919 RepID=UPI00340403CA